MEDVIRGHISVLKPCMGPMAARPDPAVVVRLRQCSACDVSDAVGRLYSMDSGIRPLYEPVRRTVGVALTVKAPPGDNLAIHTALAMAQQDDVLVVDWRGYTEACGSGALSLIDPIRRGLAGVVIDGAWRDLNELQAIDFPVFGRGISPYSPPKAAPGEVNVPVTCGGVVVMPGDLIVADAGGVAVIPVRHSAAVVAAVGPDVRRKSIDDYPLDQLRVSADKRREQLRTLYDPA